MPASTTSRGRSATTTAGRLPERRRRLFRERRRRDPRYRARAMNRHSRVVVCGLIAEYNATEPYGSRTVRSVLVNRIRMQGMIVFDWKDRYGEALTALPATLPRAGSSTANRSSRGWRMRRGADRVAQGRKLRKAARQARVMETNLGNADLI